jgi:phage gp45-like
MFKLTILETFIKNTFRVIKGETYKDSIHHAKQYSSGGDDYNPSVNTETIASTINNNETETVILLYNDGTSRISNFGEKRIYSTDEFGSEVKASIHLKNNGSIEINSTNTITVNANTINATSNNITLNGNCNINGNCNLGSASGKAVLLETSVITDSLGKACTITGPATKVKAI